MNSKVANKGTTMERDNISEMLGQLASNSADVVHDEIELVIQEIREKATAVRSGVVTVVTGAAIGFAAFLSLCAALIIWLSSYMAPVMAALVTGAALALIGVVIAFIGHRQVKKSIRNP